MKPLQLLTIALAATLLSACVTTKQYDGPLRNRGDIAVLENPEGVTGGLMVPAINGEWPGFGIAEGYEFLPGEITITVEHVGLKPRGDKITLKFVAEAGQTYSIEHDDPPVLRETPKWEAWIERQPSRRTVSTMLWRESPEPGQMGPQQ